LTNRFANMDQGGEDEDATRDELNVNDGDRTPQNLPEEEPEQPIAEQSNEPQVNEDQAGPSGLQQADESDPDGIDPAFLAALPEDIRQEVILDHQRQQRLNELQRRQRQQSTSVAEAPNGDAPQEGENPVPAENQAEEEVLDQEFLAALPPELQEEVLAQHEQRLAQQAARNAAANQNPDPAGADSIASFLNELNPTLRAQVLADADDSVIQILPENLAAEANRIRRNYHHEV
jgi:E3 ubiquitin-protein ligase HUWE1